MTTTTRRPPRTEPVARPLAATDPVARVLVDLPHAHLDHPFDYAVTAEQAESAQPGVRVRVRFAGRTVDGLVLERRAAPDHDGRLAPLSRVVSSEPVLAPEIARLVRRVADRYAGTVADVLRLAVPPRHAAVERALSPGPDAVPAGQAPGASAAVPVVPPGALPAPAARPAPPAPVSPPAARSTAVPSAPAVALPATGPWTAVPGGRGFLTALGDPRRGRPDRPGPRAVWQAPPGAGTTAADWPTALATAAVAAAAGGRGALVVVPDGRDAQRVGRAVDELAGPGQHVVLTADLGPAERYRRWLAVRRGRVSIVVGTRAAAFAPVADLALVALWDDGDDLHAEPRAPYPHSREVLLLRAHDTGCAVLLAGHARTAEAAQLVATGWAEPLDAPRDAVRRAAPRTRVAGDDCELDRDAAAAARLPSLAWRTARDALERGPVLVQVPRRGYIPAVACRRCRGAARCPACHGPLGVGAGQDVLACAWCTTPAPGWTCPGCGAAAVRSRTTGSERTAYELARAFPGVPIVTSERDRVHAVVSDEPALVVATPGAEPIAEHGYAAALLLDGAALLGRSDLRAAEEALRRWLAAAALVRPSADGGVVVLVAPPEHPATQALLRWDPVGAAARELAERIGAGLPPAVRLAELTGGATDVSAVLATAALPPGAATLGPFPLDPDRAAGPVRAAGPARAAGAARSSGAALPPGSALPVTGHVDVEPAAAAEPRVRALVRVPPAQGLALARALRDAQSVRVAKRRGEHVRIRVDPVDLA